ncbi:hypothetical protein J2Y45_003194 [Dyadobacter sp. BE34]|uniref:Uncharacterized protein n=1 Tax=Dyadobacter fermentans TaxID=94254 RepID=A0ABU1QXX5_9BACT|nr:MULTISPECIES: hypothetical protein [Dyadobacter]MDR6806001.1 hypothetical protein [Dyadobacter fermentans]MDR7043742.1 hypothetical protein [Dyadobacter sp. BE242]MDR7198054.1 hypothetical protein [Dyadobacter sp. BE34]MDR7216016.1 hypothetical protein [Dyadobacter sp. BE31]MDR7264458.1 hypothetical protein [Dyadobacter sp. BE32]
MFRWEIATCATSAASAALAEAKKQGKAQLKAIRDILAATLDNGGTLAGAVSVLREVK